MHRTEICAIERAGRRVNGPAIWHRYGGGGALIETLHVTKNRQRQSVGRSVSHTGAATVVRPRKENPEIPGDQNHPTTTANLKEGDGRIHEVFATPDGGRVKNAPSFFFPAKLSGCMTSDLVTCIAVAAAVVVGKGR